jgi:hypothetical protein
MTALIKKQIKLFKKYGITNYTIENDKIIINDNLDLSYFTEIHKDLFKGLTINGSLNLYSLKEVHKDLFKGLIINGYLDLSSLKEAHKDLFRGLTINGSLYLDSLTTAHKDLFRGLTINGSLYLGSLTTAHKDLFKGLTLNGYLNLCSLKTAHKDLFKGLIINGWLDLPSLKDAHKDLFKGLTINGDLYLYLLTYEERELLRKNTTKLEEGYNKEKGYCYFDGILSKVLSVTTKLGYTIYTTPFEYIVQKGEYAAHAKTPKKGIEDVKFKIFVETLKNENIQKDTLITVKLYRLLTGACDNGVQQWLKTNNIPFKVVDNETIEEKPITAEELLPLLEETKAYGLNKIKSLINW